LNVSDEGYSRNSLCALHFDIYVFITVLSDSFVFTTINLIYFYGSGVQYSCFLVGVCCVAASKKKILVYGQLSIGHISYFPDYDFISSSVIVY